MAKVQHPEIARALGPVVRSLDPVLGPGPEPTPIVVACSGGRDSVALLGLMELAARPRAVTLVVAHVDHGLRPESGAEAQAVQALADRRGHGFVARRLALAPGPGLPARARDARRAALQEVAAAHGAAAIALGHTATDQAETVLMHLTRGAGLEGLAAMAPFCGEGPDRAPWIRPILHLTRAQTGDLARRLEFPFVDDPSNADLRHLRVRVRERVLPVLRDVNPGVERAIAAAARQARDGEEALQIWAARELEGRVVPGARDGDPVRLDLTGFDRVPRAVRTRVIRRFIVGAGVDAGCLGVRMVDAVEAAIVGAAGPGHTPGGAPVPRSWDLHPRRRLRLDRRGLWVENTAAMLQYRSANRARTPE